MNLHPCFKKCSRFSGEQCNTCLVSDEQPDFAVGDLVVPKSNEINFVNAVRKVMEVDGDQIRVLIDGYIRSYWTHGEGWRKTTSEEKAAGYRIDETEEELLAEAEVWRECREPCRFDQLEVEPANGWAINPITQNNTVCTEEETPELFESKHCSPRNYNNVTDAQRLKELDASVDRAKAALATFNYKPIPTDRELKQAEQIRVLRTDRNVWCAMFFIAVVGYGVARWML